VLFDDAVSESQLELDPVVGDGSCMGTAMMKSASTLGVQLLQNGKPFPTAINLLTRAAESLAANSVAHILAGGSGWGSAMFHDIQSKCHRSGIPSSLLVKRPHC
jgi:hypothetical protein